MRNKTYMVLCLSVTSCAVIASDPWSIMDDYWMLSYLEDEWAIEKRPAQVIFQGPPCEEDPVVPCAADMLDMSDEQHFSPPVLEDPDYARAQLAQSLHILQAAVTDDLALNKVETAVGIAGMIASAANAVILLPRVIENDALNGPGGWMLATCVCFSASTAYIFNRLQQFHKGHQELKKIENELQALENPENYQ